MTLDPALLTSLDRPPAGTAVRAERLPHASIVDANAVFGVDGWDCATTFADCVWKSKGADGFHAAYVARVRLSVRIGTATVCREAVGTGEARTTTPGEAHDVALKAAEADALRRAFATFGRRFGLAKGARRSRGTPKRSGSASEQAAGRDRPTGTPPRPDPFEGVTDHTAPTGHIDKNLLTIPEPRRRRSASHLRFVAAQPCLICGRRPADAHHLQFAQPRAMGLKTSDEFTVPLCRLHHGDLHRAGDEAGWWAARGIDPVPEADRLWLVRGSQGGGAAL